MQNGSVVVLIWFNSDTAAWMTFLVTLEGKQTRLHLIKQEQTEGKLRLVMEMDFKHAKHYFASTLRWNMKNISVAVSLAVTPNTIKGCEDRGAM